MSDDFSLEFAVEFAENPEPRCPCVLLLDTSGSMDGAPLDALHEGLRAFKTDLLRDSLASRRVEVAVMTFDDSANLVQNFVTVDRFEPPVFTAGGHTCMATAILDALDLVKRRKEIYRNNGITYYRPWIFLITDGEPDEDETMIQLAADRVRQEEQAAKIIVFAVGVGNANLQRLSQLVVRPPVRLDGLNFVDLFMWLSRSMENAAQAKLDEQLALPVPRSGFPR
jgi:uncharacterized protein YegL